MGELGSGRDDLGVRARRADVAPDRAGELVRAARPGALETPAQVAFVGRFRDAWLSRDGSPVAGRMSVARA